MNKKPLIFENTNPLLKKVGNLTPPPLFNAKLIRFGPLWNDFSHFLLFFVIFFLFFFWIFFFSGHANKWAPKSQCFSIIRILKHFIFGEVEQYVITRVFWHTQIHLTETGFENNSPLFYRKLTFSVEGKMGISEKLE